MITANFRATATAARLKPILPPKPRDAPFLKEQGIDPEANMQRSSRDNAIFSTDFPPSLNSFG